MQDVIFSSLRLHEFSVLLKEALREVMLEAESAPPPSKSQYITKKEISQLFHVSLSTVNNWDKAKVIKRYQIGGRVLFKIDEVEKKLSESNKV